MSPFPNLATLLGQYAQGFRLARQRELEPSVPQSTQLKVSVGGHLSWDAQRRTSWPGQASVLGSLPGGETSPMPG